MFYTSTRDNSVKVTASKAITDGISKDGGLYIPTEIPAVSLDELKNLCSVDYKERAKKILGLYLTDFTKEELDSCVEGAYSDGKFSSKDTAPTVKLHDNVSILELFKGPTCAFKDMALQILPYLLTVSAKKNLENKEIVILVATSGDTGKAALEGFKDVDGTKIQVFYPTDGVSDIQKLQMQTQEGSNVSVVGIVGNGYGILIRAIGDGVDTGHLVAAYCVNRNLRRPRNSALSHGTVGVGKVSHNPAELVTDILQNTLGKGYGRAAWGIELVNMMSLFKFHPVVVETAHYSGKIAVHC